MANTVTGVIEGQAYSYTTLGDYANKSGYAGYSGSSYYTNAIKFTTPDFVGASESIEIGLIMRTGVGASATLRYAVCTSDANKAAYMSTTDDVTDENQIATGTVTFEDLKSDSQKRTFTIATSKIKPNATYYLFLWASGKTGVSLDKTSGAGGDFTVIVSYNSGLVYIDNGSALEAYQCYIDNGSDWDLHIPYIDNGTSWDMCN